MITHNLSVQHGIANGTIATIHSIAWHEPGDRDNVLAQPIHSAMNNCVNTYVHLTPRTPAFVIVNLSPDSPSFNLRRNASVNGLPENLWPVPLVSIDVRVKIANGHFLSARMKQFPITCADAITFHKIQGVTIPDDKIVRIGTFDGASHSSIYTALTRVRSRQQLYFTFPISADRAKQWKIKKCLAAELRMIAAKSQTFICRVNGEST